MKISDIHSAKGLKFRLKRITNDFPDFKDEEVVGLRVTANPLEFCLSREGGDNKIFTTDYNTASYISDLLTSDELGCFRCLFTVEDKDDNGITLQAYVFRSAPEYKTPIVIKVNGNIREKYSNERLSSMFVWNGLGKHAVFVLSYKDSKRKNEIRFLSDKNFLHAKNTACGILAEKIDYIRERNDLPVDVYFAPEIIFSDETKGGANDDFSEDINKISDSASYFSRWEAYNDLSKKLIENHAREFGNVEYTSVESETTAEGIWFKFAVSEAIEGEYIGETLAVEVEGNEDISTSVIVGTLLKSDAKEAVVFRSNSEKLIVVPRQGSLVLSTLGDITVIKRRDKAKQRMLIGRSPIKSIVRLIEEGVSGLDIYAGLINEKAVTDKFKRVFKKATSLNDDQKRAIEVALNTPDIAIIQGPPGTGKTTVIQAICERFREVYEKQQRELQKADPAYVMQRPKILITSFQNEAVENAISRPSAGDMPAYRIARKGKVGNQFQNSLDLWHDETRRILNVGECAEAERCINLQNEMQDAFFEYKNKGEPIETAIEIINRYLSFAEINYPKNIRADAENFVQEYRRSVSPQSFEAEDPFIIRLNSQRLTREAFADDGIKNARKLLSQLSIRDDIEIEPTDLAAIKAVCGTESVDDKNFSEYVSTVCRLKEKFCNDKTEVNINDKKRTDEIIFNLSRAFRKGVLELTDSLEARKAIIVAEFLSRFDEEYEKLVEKYSLTTASTCQMSMKSGNGDEVYDLVIVDEAARANPLDLFIPMSMGKKIILVGDHKQLPHMLESDVLNLIQDDPKYKDLPGIEISLFERLYSIFEKGSTPKAVPLTLQYRMHPSICEFVSSEFYEGKLKTAPEITAKHRETPDEVYFGKPLVYVNIRRTCDTEGKGKSKFRYSEVRAITEDVKKILKVVPDGKIGIITFYSKQSELLKKSMDDILNAEQKTNIEVGTVDAFQGKEFDFVLLSCVRANDKKDLKEKVGFLIKPNRVCVAFSRAKRQIVLYGDSETLNEIPYFKAYYDVCKTGEGHYREY